MPRKKENTVPEYVMIRNNAGERTILASDWKRTGEVLGRMGYKVVSTEEAEKILSENFEEIKEVEGQPIEDNDQQKAAE